MTTPVLPLGAARALNSVTDEVVSRVSRAPLENWAYSPITTTIALAILSEAATGGCRSAMHRLLRAEDAAALHIDMRQLLGWACPEPGPSEPAPGAWPDMRDDNREELIEWVARSRRWQAHPERRRSIGLAASLWLQSGREPLQTFSDFVANNYGPVLRSVDFRTDPELQRTTINQWCSDRTQGAIVEALPHGAVMAGTSFVVASATYLKMEWLRPFDPERTCTEGFRRRDGSAVACQMMHDTADMTYAEGDGWQGVVLPYNDLSTIFVAAVSIDPAGDVPSCADVLASTYDDEVKVVLSLPSHRITSETNLLGPLRAAGLTELFEPGLPGVFENGWAPIDDARQATMFVTDEAGSSGAAVDMMVMRGMKAPRREAVVTFDRPFTFWICEKATGAVLFMGRVNDPTA
ncbi:MAG: hypothetical protein RJA49_714 [Actinomycetota bacterium]